MAATGNDLEAYFLEKLPAELKRVALELWHRERGSSRDEVLVAGHLDNIGAPPSYIYN